MEPGRTWSEAPQLRLDAPISRSRQEKTFTSESECRAWRDAQMQRMTAQMDQTLKDMPVGSSHTRDIQPSLRRRDQASFSAYESSQCLASTDARLPPARGVCPATTG
jgi:hypothetical protein